MKPTASSLVHAGFPLALAAFLAAPAAAQEQGYDHGRIRLAEPGVTLQRATEPGAEEAMANAPFFPGDRVWTDGAARAEFQFPEGSSLRLDRRSKLDYVAHEDGSGDQTVALRLWSGSLFLHVRDGSMRFEVEVPGGLVSISRRGVYRVDGEPQETRILVYDGEAVVDAGERRTVVEEGEALIVRRGEWPDEPRGFDRDREDEFAAWDRSREELERDRHESRSARYLPREVSPYASEFDSYGTWHYETEVGYVWAPRVHVGWRPYWNGRWSWTAYGWTWIPAEPWGFAPSHYGRWGFSMGLGWYWIPGRVWGPAWVSWAWGGSYVGWCPLGYRDRPVWGLDRAVPRGHGSGAGGRGGAWTFARRGDVGARDLARRRLDADAVDIAQLRVADSPRSRPSRDLSALETPRAVPRAGYETRASRETAPAARSDRSATIPWPGAVRGDRESDRRAPAASEGARARAGEVDRSGAGTRSAPGERSGASERPSARARTGEGGQGARSPEWPRPQSESGTNSRDREDDRGRSSTRRDSAPDAREGAARPRERQPDRDVMRQLFTPLSEPRAAAPREETRAPRGSQRPESSEGSRSRGDDAGSRGYSPPRTSGEGRAQPAPRAEPRRESRPSAPPPSRGGDAERRKPPRD